MQTPTFFWRYCFFIVLLVLGLIGLSVSAVFYPDHLMTGFLAAIGIGWPVAAFISSEI